MSQSISIIWVEEGGISTLKEECCWYTYLAKKGDRKLQSFILLPTDLTEEELKREILSHINERGFEQFVALNQTSPRLNRLINECHASENEMLFCEYSDEEWNNLSEKEQKKLLLEIEENKLNDYIETDFLEEKTTRDALITVYGGISEVVNFSD